MHCFNLLKNICLFIFPQYLKNINGGYYKNKQLLLIQNVRFPRSFFLLYAYVLQMSSISDTNSM